MISVDPTRYFVGGVVVGSILAHSPWISYFAGIATGVVVHRHLDDIWQHMLVVSGPLCNSVLTQLKGMSNIHSTTT